MIPSFEKGFLMTNFGMYLSNGSSHDEMYPRSNSWNTTKVWQARGAEQPLVQGKWGATKLATHSKNLGDTANSKDGVSLWWSGWLFLADHAYTLSEQDLLPVHQTGSYSRLHGRQAGHKYASTLQAAWWCVLVHRASWMEHQSNRHKVQLATVLLLSLHPLSYFEWSQSVV